MSNRDYRLNENREQCTLMRLNMERMQQLVGRARKQSDVKELTRIVRVVDNFIAQQEKYPKLKEPLALQPELSTTRISTPSTPMSISCLRKPNIQALRKPYQPTLPR